ncbi:MAG: flagellin lysine-N-methylase [Clostridia bacterium]|nr:flagellin lysine-N-methylase [Clostridia bacterium]
MKLYAPNYYKDFHCIASDCKHSCCVGWEIDIDKDSLSRYQSMTHPYGEIIRKHIEMQDDTACFALTKEERCPFLKENGLCDMILTLGEDSLCQICRDHPRFRSFFSDREEIGIGLCCEEAARLVLCQKEKTEVVMLSDDGENEDLWEEEDALLALREKLFDILQNRSIPLAERADRMLQKVSAKPITDLPSWIERLMSLEQLDPAWQKLLNKLNTQERTPKDLDWPLEKFMLYLLYRHLPNAEDESEIRATVRFAYLGYLLVKTICENTNTPIEEAARLFSSEIEYSEENTATLMAFLRE